MNLEELNKKITNDFSKGNYRENFKDLVKIYKLDNNSEVANKIGVILIKLSKKKFAKKFFEISIKKNKKNL